MLDYAKLETEQTKFPKSEELLRKILDQDALDYDALLASGDNYLEWAKRDERYYDNARDAYVRILRGKDGARDEPWLHMLRYHMRTDNLAEVERIKSMFESDKRKKIDPVIYTELGGYLIGRGKLDDVKSILSRSMKAKRDLPETYYNFSRFFKETGDSVKEREALSFTLHYLNEAHSTPERLAVRINTHNRIGEIHYEGGEHLNAEKEFQKAMKLIRDGAERKLLPQDPAFGQVFYNSGDIHYYVHRNLDVSEALYKEARNYGFENTELNYKLGYINYVGGDYGNALLEFYQIASQYRNNRNLLYSIANTLYNRNDFFAAQGYYNRLLDHLEDQQSKIPLLRPQEDAQHRSLIEILMKTHNNLGVTLKKLSESPRNPEKETQSLVSLTRSSQFFDVLSRDPETLSRGQTKNLAYLNTRGILYPQADFIPQIYRRIPKDSAAAHF
jgi:tetratricopeptide (TPR) repeat protein